MLARLRHLRLTASALLLAACGSAGESAAPRAERMQVGPCDAPEETATFEITLTGTWSAASHPGDFPAGGHFSAPVGATHRTLDLLWARDGIAVATDGVEEMAETGGTGALRAEIAAHVAAGDAEAELLANGFAGSGSTTAMVTTSRAHPLLSLTTMVAPSPDWFLGVRNVELCSGGAWIDDLTIELDAVYDAGTDDGPSFASANADRTPHAPIHLVSEDGVHFTGSPPPLVTLRIRRVP